MKKSLFLLPFLLLSSCQKKQEKIFLPLLSENRVKVGSNTDYLFETLNTETLKKKIEDKDDFPLFVSAPGCGTCDMVTLLFKDYLRETKAVFPQINLNQYLNLGTLPKISDTTFLVFKKGEIIFSDSKISSAFMTTEELKNYLDSHLSYTIVNYTDYLLRSPLRSDFNGYSFEKGIKIQEENRISTFDLDFFQSHQSKLLFLSRKIEDDTLFSYLSSASLDGYCFVKENLSLGNLEEVSLVKEKDFVSAIISYHEKGYSFEEVTLS